MIRRPPRSTQSRRRQRQMCIRDRVISNANITLSIDPKNVDALMLRGVAYFQTKNYTAAKADLERLKNDPKYGAQATNLLKNLSLIHI